IHALFLIAEALADTTDSDSVNDNITLFQCEAELVSVMAYKRAGKVPVVPVVMLLGIFGSGLDNHQRRLSTAVAHVEVLLEHDLLVLKALVTTCLAGVLLESLHLVLECLEGGLVIGLPDGRVRRLTRVDDISQRHAVSRQHGRVSVNQDLLDTQPLSDSNGG